MTLLAPNCNTPRTLNTLRLTVFFSVFLAAYTPDDQKGALATLRSSQRDSGEAGPAWAGHRSGTFGGWQRVEGRQGFAGQLTSWAPPHQAVGGRLRDQFPSLVVRGGLNR